MSDAAFSPDGARIVTASVDKTARVWDATTGMQTAILQGHEKWVRAATFSPEGARIVTTSEDKTARVWLVRGADLLKFADERVSRELTQEERRLYADLLAADTAMDR